MDHLQFRVLYRQFLFRMVDFELLSAQAQGDMDKLFGQLASLLIWLSLGPSIAGFLVRTDRMQPMQRLLFVWSAEHFLIATTMLIVGLLAVLSWDSTFPDKRDVMVLAPLPIPPKTLFLAKVAGVGAALSVTVLSLHGLAQFSWPAVFAAQPAIVFAGQSIPASGGVLNFFRTLAAYWITMFAAGAFVFCCVLGVQGIAAQILPRRLYLRASSALQLGAFCFFICGYLLQPMIATPQALAAAQGNGPAAWQFSFWFLGLFQQLKGSPALPVLAQRAWIGLAVAVSVTSTAYLLSYFHMLRKIVEEPDIAPSARGARWLPGFGGALQTAIGQFSVRSLLRSRQHRIIFAFYIGVGFALTVFLLKVPKQAPGHQSGAWSQLNTPLMATTFLMMLLSVVGMRIVFAMPLDLKANWIFRIAPVRGGADCLAARRRAMLALGVAPVWLAQAALLFTIGPRHIAAAHMLILALFGAIAVEACLQGFQRIPFTCSYLPGKTNIQVTFVFSVLVVFTFLNYCAELELRSIAHPARYWSIAAAMAILIAIARWRMRLETSVDEIGIQFEDEGSPAIQGLGLTG